MKELISIAIDNGIEWIPLIQTFGHIEYLSRIKGTESFFENPEYPQQLCPLKKEVKNYLEALIDIVCELHPESRYIHVGQDETHQLGFCHKCKEEVRKTGRIPFFLKHTEWVWKLVRSKGKMPLFWADMFFTENQIEPLKKVDDEVIPVVWEYNDTKDTTHEVYIGGIKPAIADAKNRFRIDNEIPISRFEKDENYFEDLPEKIINIIGIDKKTKLPLSFPQTHIIAKIRKNFWVACAVYNCSDMLFSPSFIRGVLNPVMLVKISKKLNIKALIATNWARAHSYAPISPPWTLTLYNIAYFAASAYTGKTEPDDLEEISNIVADEIGMPSNFGRFSVDDILYVISANAPGPGIIRRIRNLENVLSILKEKEIKGIFGKGLEISVEAELLWSKLLFLQEETRWWTQMKKSIPLIIKKEMEQRFRLISMQIKMLKQKALDYYTGFVGDKSSFETWWNGLFQLDLYITEQAIKSLKK